MRFAWCGMAGAVALLWLRAVVAAPDPAPMTANNAADNRVRAVVYSPDQIYRLRGYAGYQVDLEFEPGERFVGLGAGDVQGLGFSAQANHLFLKPRAITVRTNLTVLTDRRSYHFDYTAGAAPPDANHADVVYVLRFIYPSPPPLVPDGVSSPDKALSQASAAAVNANYWYCGGATLQPLAAWDDGVHTHLQFDARSELPAVFVRNDDGSESLLNFNVEHGEVVIHRIARQFVVRRGRLAGCIVNRGFAGSGASLESGTVAPGIERTTRAADDVGAVR
jgi:type IV secretion system protein VirB9